MRIDSAKLFEGSKFTNLTVDSGASFPLSPDLGELFLNTTDNDLYYYNGTTWVKPSGGGGGLGAQIHFGEDPPVDPEEFPFWWNTQYAALLLWYQDVDSSQWVEIIGGNVVSGSTVMVNPVSPEEGDIRIIGTVISIYADGAWRQVFPAVYS